MKPSSTTAMNTIDKIVASRYGSASAFPPEYTGVPMRSPATSIVLAEAVKRSKGKSPGFLATVKAWLRELIMMLQPEAAPQPAECR
jgi:hypothetical protein